MAEKKFTAYGFLALLFWSTASALSRTLSEDLGIYTAAFLIHIISGSIAITYTLIANGGFKQFKGISNSYWLVCGFFYALYVIMAYIAVGIADTREQVMVVVLIKYLWPLLTLIFAIPVLKTRASPWLVIGILLSLAGIVVANLGSNVTDLASFLQKLSGSVVPYILGFLAAIGWALFSDFSRKLAVGSEGGVGFFMLGTGLIMGFISLFVPEETTWSTSTISQLIYQAVIPSFLATLLWDAAMRKGKLIIVLIASNFVPLLTIIVTALILGQPLHPSILAGALLVVAGTTWSKRCFDSRVQVDTTNQATVVETRP